MSLAVGIEDHPSYRARAREADAIEAARAAEIATHRTGVVWSTVELGAFTAFLGLLVMLGGEQRLSAAIFRGPARLIPGWPATWAVFIGVAGVLLIAGYLLQVWHLGIAGAVGVALWSGSFAVLNWVSINDPETGARVAWYPIATYGLICSSAVKLAWWLTRLRASQRDPHES